MSLFNNKCVHSLQYIYSNICTETPNGRNSIGPLPVPHFLVTRGQHLVLNSVSG